MLDKSMLMFDNESLRTENAVYRRMAEEMLLFLDALIGDRNGVDLDALAAKLQGDAALVVSRRAFGDAERPARRDRPCLAFRGGERRSAA